MATFNGIYENAYAQLLMGEFFRNSLRYFKGDVKDSEYFRPVLSMLDERGIEQKIYDRFGVEALMKYGVAPQLPKVGAAPTHFDEFAERCLAGGKARSDFAWTTYMTDAILLGGVAERLPGRRHVWNDAVKAFDTGEANALLKSSYRSGWSM